MFWLFLLCTHPVPPETGDSGVFQDRSAQYRWLFSAVRLDSGTDPVGFPALSGSQKRALRCRQLLAPGVPRHIPSGVSKQSILHLRLLIQRFLKGTYCQITGHIAFCYAYGYASNIRRQSCISTHQAALPAGHRHFLLLLSAQLPLTRSDNCAAIGEQVDRKIPGYVGRPARPCRHRSYRQSATPPMPTLL